MRVPDAQAHRTSVAEQAPRLRVPFPLFLNAVLAANFPSPQTLYWRQVSVFHVKHWWGTPYGFPMTDSIYLTILCMGPYVTYSPCTCFMGRAIEKAPDG